MDESYGVTSEVVVRDGHAMPMPCSHKDESCPWMNHTPSVTSTPQGGTSAGSSHLQPQIGHNIGFQAPTSPRSAWAPGRAQHTARVGMV